MIKAVFLDLGGVILEVNWLPVLKGMGILDPEEQQRVIAKVRDWDEHYQYERGQMTELDFFTKLAELIEHEDASILKTAWNKMLIHDLPGVDQIFAEFKDKIPLYALSNTNPTHIDHLIANFPVMKKFDRVFTSFELGHRKPDPEIYILAAEKAGVKPSEILFIDDNQENIDAALGVGYKAFKTVNDAQESLRIIREHLK